jgi:hypothetical protein
LAVLMTQFHMTERQALKTRVVRAWTYHVYATETNPYGRPERTSRGYVGQEIDLRKAAMTGN